MTLSQNTRVTMQVGQVVTLVVDIFAGASWASKIDAKATSAQTDAAEMKAELKQLRQDISTLQGDTRAMLQILRLGKAAP